jgi:extracellular elastinolytic metalloproteinase
MENSIIVHEFGHGVSNRLVGGGTATCQSSLESRGLGEGWSDILAEFVFFRPCIIAITQKGCHFISWIHQTSGNTEDFTLGTYAIPYPFRHHGFRDFPYSTDM